MDHFVAVGSGGTHALENLMPCCRLCNRRQGSLSIEAFKDVMRKHQGAVFTVKQETYLKARSVGLPEPEEVEFWFEQQGLT